jgi:hypothetical protein
MKKSGHNFKDSLIPKRFEQPSHVTSTSHYSLLPILLLAVACFSLPTAPNAFAVSPPPDGGYPGANTAEGDSALFNLTSGINNTAVGSQALSHDTSGSYNMAVGSRALALNATGHFNMAIGTEALYNNNANSNSAIGFRVLYFNTAGNNLTGVGAGALYSNIGGSLDTAVGAATLNSNTTGNFNTALGASALKSNTSGSLNTAVGYQALFSSTGGTHEINTHNTAIGNAALYNADGGGFNTAVGSRALYSYTHRNAMVPGYNTAVGFEALANTTTGDYNTAFGNFAGSGVTTADNVIAIGAEGADVSNSCYIGNIAGADATGGDPVFITNEGKLGTVNPPSAMRFKEDIKPMNEASEAVLALKPVTFRYKKEFDPKRIPQFGLVAEEVEKVNPDLVKRDRDGKLQTVRYDSVNAMLLNEFLKEHSKVQEQGREMQEQKDKINRLNATVVKQEATIAQKQKDFQSAIVRQQQRFELTLAEQEKQIAALTSGLQKLNAQVRMVKPAPQVAANNP